MANVLIPKKSTVAARVPTTSDLALGEIAINHADAKLFARHPVSGTVQEIGGGASAAVERFWAFALIGNAIYLGSISTSDFPSTGSVYDVATWDINKTTSNAAGDVTATASAVGAFSNKQNLTYA